MSGILSRNAYGNVLTRAGSACFVADGGGSFGCSRFRLREGA